MHARRPTARARPPTTHTRRLGPGVDFFPGGSNFSSLISLWTPRFPVEISSGNPVFSPKSVPVRKKSELITTTFLIWLHKPNSFRERRNTCSEIPQTAEFSLISGAQRRKNVACGAARAFGIGKLREIAALFFSEGQISPRISGNLRFPGGSNFRRNFRKYISGPTSRGAPP